MARKPRKKKDTNFYPDSVGDYPVGYGKVPERSKYKKGQPSPYPAGRPKGSKNKQSPDRLATMIEEEGSRMVDIKHGGRLKKMSTERAIVRSINLGAIAGKTRSQKLAMDLLAGNEQKKRDERNVRFQAAVDYKKRWADESKIRRQRGEPDPKVYPHPDDFLLNYETSEVTFTGAMSADQEEYLHRVLDARKYFQTAIHETMEAGDTDHDDNAALILADLKHAVKVLRIIDKALDAWSDDFFEPPDWDRMGELKGKLAKEMGLDLNGRSGNS